MKTNHSIWIAGVLAAFVANECRGDLNGSDDFNDNSKDPLRWGADIFSGVAVFTEVNQRLEYTTSGTVTPNEFIARPWVLNTGSTTQNWEMQIDVSVPSFALTNGQQVSLGLIAFDDDLNKNNRSDIQFGREFRNDTNDFRAGFGANGVGFPYVHARTAATFAALRIAFMLTAKFCRAFMTRTGRIVVIPGHCFEPTKSARIGG